MKVLWLASWYPNPTNPFDGDFVQRHAKALSAYTPLTVYYVSQSGGNQVKQTVEHVNQGLKEKIVSFRFRKTGFVVFDKLVYNWRYFTTYKKILRAYFQKEGKPDIVHVHVPMKSGMIARWIKKRWKIPFIVSEHSTHYGMGTDDDFFNKSSRHRRNVAKVFGEALIVTNVSFALGQRLKEIFLLHDTRVIRNTVDTALFSYQPSYNSGFTFIHVSTLAEHQKNIKGILNSVGNLSKDRADFRVIIVGPAGKELKQIVLRAGLEHLITFTGEIPYSEVAVEMKKASALILFSRYENLPCVISEALCCGLPVIASDVGGIKEVINESNGVLVEEGNEQALVTAMDMMIKEYGRYSRKEISEKASQQFGFSEIGRQFYELYNEILV